MNADGLGIALSISEVQEIVTDLRLNRGMAYSLIADKLAESGYLVDEADIRRYCDRSYGKTETTVTRSSVTRPKKPSRSKVSESFATPAWHGHRTKPSGYSRRNGFY